MSWALFTKEHGSRIIATVEDIKSCHCNIYGVEPTGDGDFEWNSDGTEVNYDGQETRTDANGEPLFYDEDFDIFPKSAIELIEICDSCDLRMDDCDCECGDCGDSPCTCHEPQASETEDDDEDLPTITWGG